jgi:hypothetical protein
LGKAPAAVVMTWNVAYSHLWDHVLTNRLADFNEQWPLSYGGMHKKKPLTITSLDEHQRPVKESEFLTVCRDADTITTNVFTILDGALKKRNAAAIRQRPRSTRCRRTPASRTSSTTRC